MFWCNLIANYLSVVAEKNVSQIINYEDDDKSAESAAYVSFIRWLYDLILNYPSAVSCRPKFQ